MPVAAITAPVITSQVPSLPSRMFFAMSEPMAVPPPQAVTQLLRAWSDGDESGLEQLTPLGVAELCRLTRGGMRLEGKSHTPNERHWTATRFCSLHDEPAGGAC